MDDLGHFLNFLTEQNVLTIALIAIVSDKMIHFSNTFMDSLIVPLFNIDWNNDGQKDLAKIEDAQVCFKGMTFDIGKLYISFVKLVIILVFVFIVAMVVKKTNILKDKAFI